MGNSNYQTTDELGYDSFRQRQLAMTSRKQYADNAKAKLYQIADRYDESKTKDIFIAWKMSFTVTTTIPYKSLSADVPHLAT